jgi:hypothetical protein
MPPGGPEIVYKVFASSFDKLQAARFELAQTWTNEFVTAVKIEATRSPP